MIKSPAKGVIQNGVLVGRDGYLFLADGGHNVSDFVTGKRDINLIYFDIFRKNLECRAGWAERNGAQYVHIIMPDKQSIIPEAWTLPPPLICLGKLYLERNKDFFDKLIYPADLLEAHKASTILRTDTHITAFGSMLIARFLVEKFSAISQEKFFQEIICKLDKEVASAGDLGSKLEPPVYDTLKLLGAEPPGILFSNNVVGGNNGVIDLRFNHQAIYQKRVVIFGDSFGREIARMLQFWYHEVYFFRTGFFYEEIACQCKPDILITENVERYMNHCIADDERPQFLLYPFLGKKPYNPSKEFVEALSAVLSYPRKPYLDFMSGLKFDVKVVEPVVVVASDDVVQCYDFSNMADLPEAEGVLRILEEPKQIQRRMPEFVADFSGQGLGLNLPPEQEIHGSYLVQRKNVLLFGQNHLVSSQGHWSCEARSFKRQFLSYMHTPFYGRRYPGAKPEIDYKNPKLLLRTSSLTENDIERIDTPVFLATPLEPGVWGRWIATVAPKVMQYKQSGMGRKFFCYAALDWQKAFLKLLGINEDMILQHDPGRTYICRDVMTVEYSVTNMTISASERMNFFEMVAKHKIKMETPRKLFVSRLSRSRSNPRYRVLRNETELAAMLKEFGFVAFEPETLPFEAQISIFAAAEQVVFLGGSGVYNAAFCAPGTSVVTIESSNDFINPHTELLASLDLRYGVIFGQQDISDESMVHKRWTIDVPHVRDAVAAFFPPT